MDLGQFFTNFKVAQYMLSMLNVQQGEHLMDPCYGTGVFLEAASQAGVNLVSGYELDPQLALTVAQRYPLYSLVQGDFLQVPERNCVDKIIMNPPYLRHEKLDDLYPLGITKRIIRKDPWMRQLPASANLYMYFILKALQLLKRGGEMAVIFPSSWLNAKVGKTFSGILNGQSTLLRQVHVSGDLFDRNALVEVLILHLRKGQEPADPKYEWVRLEGGNLVPTHTASAVPEIGLHVPLTRYASVRRGLTTGYNKLFINPDVSGYTTPILSTPKAVRGYHTRHAKLDRVLLLERGAPVDPGIRAYLDSWENTILQQGKPRTLLERIQKGKRDWYALSPIDSRGLLFSYFVREEPRFLYNPSGVLARDNFYILQPRQDGLLLFALLNNYYTFYQMELFGKRYGAGLLKLQRYDMERLKLVDMDSLTLPHQATLRESAQQLIETGAKEHIHTITKVLATYAAVSHKEVHHLYCQARTRRLSS